MISSVTFFVLTLHLSSLRVLSDPGLSLLSLLPITYEAQSRFVKFGLQFFAYLFVRIPQRQRCRRGRGGHVIGLATHRLVLMRRPGDDFEPRVFLKRRRLEWASCHCHGRRSAQPEEYAGPLTDMANVKLAINPIRTLNAQRVLFILQPTIHRTGLLGYFEENREPYWGSDIRDGY